MEEHDFTTTKGLNVHYLAAGPSDGPVMVFCHGWPAIAKTWEFQIETFSSLGFRVVAPDMPGYGGSSTRRLIEDYSLRNVNLMMLELLEHIETDKAIWIGHDWGVVAVYSFAAVSLRIRTYTHANPSQHFPERVLALVGLVRPYHTLECGLEEVTSHINRDIYPLRDYPYGQYDYQVHFQTALDRTSKWLDLDPTGVLRGIYAKGEASAIGKPALTASVAKEGGWFGGGQTPPAWLHDIETSQLSCSEEMLAEVTAAMKANGFWTANAWYANQNYNRSYSCNEWKNDGHLVMPVLFIGANFDPISDINISTIAQAQDHFVKDLTKVNMDSGHWLALEKGEEVNKEINMWLKKRFSTLLPS